MSYIEMILDNFSCISQLHGPGLSCKALLIQLNKVCLTTSVSVLIYIFKPLLERRDQ